METLDPQTCYRALASKDARFDGRFFVGVVTTGVYCRPVCPATTPRPENTQFFVCAAAAEEAGFRACRRCHPETSPDLPIWSGTSVTVSRALKLLFDGPVERPDVEALAARLGVGGRHLRRLFLQHLGAPPLAIAQARRLHLARRLLDETELSVADIADAAGFTSLRRFNDAFRKSFGAAPTELRRRTPRNPARGRPPLAAGDPATDVPLHDPGLGRTQQAAPLHTLRLPFRPPLDWPRLAEWFGRRAAAGVEAVEAGVYRRTVQLGTAAGWIEVRPAEGESALLLGLHGLPPQALLEAVRRVRRLFDLGADPLAVARVLRADPVLAERLERLPGLRIPGAWDPFELCVRAVLGQQVSVVAASTLAGRLAAAFGRPLAAQGVPPGLTHLFPRPEALAAAELERCGLTRARAAAIRGLAGRVADGRLVLESGAALDETVARLTELPGIGEWTAQYIAMRALGEPDAFPASDLGLRKALAREGRAPSERELLARAEAWRPWRAYAAMALWMG
jgi:AraC family transcriptional regulator, regulatory protein of adaptative response / DNA-3-methyladenine glycosylase II